MSTLRIVSGDDGIPWIEKKNPDGTWERATEPDEAPKYRMADLRKLNHDSVTKIANMTDHAQHKFANDILASHNEMARNLSDALKRRFENTIDIPARSSPSPTPTSLKRPTPALPHSSFKVPEIPSPPPDPTYELIAQIEEQNVILTEQRDDARKHAESAESDARWSRGLAWAAIGVTVAVGVTQIILSIVELNS